MALAYLGASGLVTAKRILPKDIEWHWQSSEYGTEGFFYKYLSINGLEYPSTDKMGAIGLQ